MSDETTKYVGAGVLPADSKVTYDRMGLTPQEQRQLVADKRRANAQATLSALAAAAQSARQDPAVTSAEARSTDGDAG